MVAAVEPTPPPPREDDTPPDNREPARVAPHSRDAEESLVGAMLHGRWAIEAARDLVLPESFWLPNLQLICDAIYTRDDMGGPTDVQTVAAVLRERGQLEQCGGRRALLELQGATPASANAATYAREVAALHSRRSVYRAALDTVELVFDRAVADVDVVERAQELLRRAELPVGGEPDMDVASFVAQPHEYRWALPGLLEVGERLLIVAPEKYGKSTLIRQIAVTASHGMHPFEQWAPIPAVNVILIDLENPRLLAQRKLQALLGLCENSLERHGDPRRLRICSRREGIVVTHRADELWLYDRIAANRAAFERDGFGASPLIVCVGPIYKMVEDELDRREVRKLQNVLERIMERFDCALIMETHAPHESFGPNAKPRSLRPAGPRTWLRWPEFCRGLESAAPGIAEFYDCQGARDERSWPSSLERGGGERAWPWRAERSM